ncbi:hypothetical protein DVH24_018899 [Malus domestica]|uniref:Uncharacterized protein n=1 Tax=Malus domestica TaxID=3750 RepID=A0A498HMQ6_MALDO|nr:hypothetical protein DVH24_018899 [Malus domestica]
MLCKGMSSDNIKGLIVVLSSSLFIGSSPPASLLLRREVEAVEERRVAEIEPFIIFHSSDEEFIAVESTVRVFQKVCEVGVGAESSVLHREALRHHAHLLARLQRFIN